MRWLRFSTGGGEPVYGTLDGETVTEVSGTPFGDHAPAGRTHALADVKIEVPVIPPTFYCVGLNYAEHIRGAAAKLGIEPNLPTQPDVGYRGPAALIADGEDVVIPPDAEKVQYEGELCVVIGREARHLSEAEALDCVLGYTIGNDVSERVWQKGDRTLWRAKSCDSFKPMGPWIETDVDLDALETVVRVNGEVTTRFPTNDMIHGVATYISTISRYCTLKPGDILWMGTDGHSPDLKAGDEVSVEIAGIGTLTNRFVDAPS